MMERGIGKVVSLIFHHGILVLFLHFVILTVSIGIDCPLGACASAALRT